MNENKLSLIFDLDGTLWDSTNTIHKVWINELDISKQDLKNLMGKTSDEIISKTSISKETFDGLQQKENIEILKIGGNIFDGVVEIIKKMSKRYNLFIVSNCQKGYIEAFLKFYNLEEYFDDFECNGNTGNNKKRNLKLLIKRNRICNAIFIGDTKLDLDAANYSKIPFILASYGFGKVKSKYKINNFHELPSMIKKVCNSMEYRDLYDANKNNLFERIKKGNKIPQGRYYITVVIFIENSKNELLLQVNKKYDKWSITGGHPKSGESSILGAQIELKEELDLNIRSNELELFKTIKTNDDFVDLYYLNKDIDLNNLRTQYEEVGDVNWFKIKELNNLIEEKKILTSHIEFIEFFLEKYKNLHCINEK